METLVWVGGVCSGWSLPKTRATRFTTEEEA
jgi:hypothetical protein